MSKKKLREFNFLRNQNKKVLTKIKCLLHSKMKMSKRIKKREKKNQEVKERRNYRILSKRVEMRKFLQKE